MLGINCSTREIETDDKIDRKKTTKLPGKIRRVKTGK
jgi:hypothetical protein